MIAVIDRANASNPKTCIAQSGYVEGLQRCVGFKKIGEERRLLRALCERRVVITVDDLKKILNDRGDAFESRAPKAALVAALARSVALEDGDADAAASVFADGASKACDAPEDDYYDHTVEAVLEQFDKTETTGEWKDMQSKVEQRAKRQRCNYHQHVRNVAFGRARKGKGRCKGRGQEHAPAPPPPPLGHLEPLDPAPLQQFPDGADDDDLVIRGGAWHTHFHITQQEGYVRAICKMHPKGLDRSGGHTLYCSRTLTPGTRMARALDMHETVRAVKMWCVACPCGGAASRLDHMKVMRQHLVPADLLSDAQLEESALASERALPTSAP